MKQHYLAILCVNILLFSSSLHAKVKESHQDRAQHPHVFLASIPKCGTHLVKKCLMMINRDHFGYPSRTFFDAGERDFKKRGSILSHAPYNPTLSQCIIDSGYKGIFMIRDPRDQAVSFIHFAQKSMKIWPSLRTAPFDDALGQWIQNTQLIKGTGRFNHPMMEKFGNIADFYSRYLPWMEHPSFYTVRFETLVGEQGGGSLEDQQQEIKNIAEHLGLELTDEKLQNIIETLFGKSRTFRKGVIGGWRDHFTEEHKRIFKECAGQLLIDLGYEENFDW